MRTVIKSSVHRTFNTARFCLSFVWSNITNTAFLTLMIALGTLATAFVAYKSARDSHEQVQLLKRQVDFNSSETRPFVRLTSSISPGKTIHVLLNVVDHGRIPARVMGYDMAIQIGRKVVEPKGGTFNTQDILYPDEPGLGVFQTLTQTEARSFTSGSEPVVVAGCVVYGSITADDTRRWKVSAAYRFDSLAGLPVGLFANEVGIPAGTDKCDASSLRDEWTSQLKLYPK
jgi:hypothetical protein